MLEILASPKHLVAVRISGAITADDIAAATVAMQNALKDNERISAFAEVDDSAHLTVEGLFKDLVESLNRVNDRKHIYRSALVTNKGWMAAMARVEGLVLSSIDVRVFGTEERNKAFAWASEEPAPLPEAKVPTPGLRLIQTTDDKVFAYEVNGHVSESDIKSTVAAANAAFEKHDKVNVLVRMKDFNGFDLSSLFNEDLIKTKYKSLSKVEKYAVIGPKPWMRNLLELINPLFKIETRIFETSDEQAAWDWVGANQALLAEKSA